MKLARSGGDASLEQLRQELAADRAAYIYVGGATALIFAFLGYMLGRHADHLAELSETDPLTGLLNARGLASRLRSEIKRARRYREPITLAFLDLDGLKQINDRHGHRAGSEAIRQVARVIRSELRESDVGARWGGDEFTVVAPNTGGEAAFTLGERLRRRIADHPGPWPVTASIGVATTMQPVGADLDHDAGELLRTADAAMYEAKLRGKNTVVVTEALSSEPISPRLR